jgi:signal transduction histidine kinase
MRGLLQQSPTEFTDVDLARIVREVLELVGPEVTRQRVALRRSLTAGLAPVRGDQVQLQQVVLNLITNAIQAMSGVRDRPRELRIGVTSGTFDQRPGQTVSVGDSGLGFAPAEVGKLFQAFYTTKPGGLGMGLAISRSIIEAHGGRLWASANPDYGATFQFAVPLGG